MLSQAEQCCNAQTARRIRKQSLELANEAHTYAYLWNEMGYLICSVSLYLLVYNTSDLFCLCSHNTFLI